MTYDIILPHYGIDQKLTDLCLRCLETIRAYSRDYRLIFVDNGSPEFDRTIPELERHPNLLVRHTVNVGFIKAVNAGLWLATAPYIVLINNDIEAVAHWLEQLRTPLDGQASMSGPLTTTKDSWQGRYPIDDSSVVALPKTAMLAFFCMMMRREVPEKVGVLDENYGIGLGDDDDYCRRAQQAGFRLALVRSLLIPHHHRSTFRALYKPDEIWAMQKQAVNRFAAKYKEQ